MTQKDKRELAARFSMTDWQRLCTNGKFLYTLRSATIDEAEVAAEALLLEWAGLNK